MLNKIIFYAFGLLFFLTPLFWLPQNSELFEFNKMLLVYLLTIVIVGAWVVKAIGERSFNIKATPLTIPILLFLAANVLSTVFSIDRHISVWGYYSRSNGGLLSILSYTLLYFALISNLDKEKIFRLINIAILGGVLVSLYAIPEHFGVSPSCVILQGELRADCWVQDVQARVFATLGQPNWLAAYLAMLIFPAIYFFLMARTGFQKAFYFVSAVLMYLAFTFAFSRGATLGLLAGLGLFGLFVVVKGFESDSKKVALGEQSSFKKSFILIAVVFLVINIIYGSALTRFQLTKLLPQDPNKVVRKVAAGQITQLENGGTESGQIRLIVWQGALDIFKHYPLFGSGVETFALSYYQFRPAAHNLVSEWDFLYNKAHNEYLNYLANTGIVGFASYMLLILTFLIWCLKKLFGQVYSTNEKLLILAVMAAFVSYLVQNFFGFSVVIIAVFFYLFPALLFVALDEVKPLKLFQIVPFIYYRDIYSKGVALLMIFISIFLVVGVVNFWRADFAFAKGSRASELGNPGRAYNYFIDAINLRNFDPYYHNELGYAAASAALALEDTDATLSAELVKEAEDEMGLSLMISPNNLSFWRTAVRGYFSLSLLDEKYNKQLFEALDKTIALAPTDPKLYYNKAIIYEQMDKKAEAEQAFKKAVELKPNYREGYVSLGLFYYNQKNYKKAVDNMGIVLKLVPNDPEVVEYLNQWGKAGIATESATAK